MEITANIVKNLLVVLTALFLYPVLAEALRPIEASSMNDFLLIISIFLVTVCFANFAFTYEKSKLGTTAGKLLSHGTTFIFMLLIATLLESMVLAVQVVYPSFYVVILGFALLLYLGVVAYDFWDYLSVNQD